MTLGIPLAVDGTLELSSFILTRGHDSRTIGPDFLGVVTTPLGAPVPATLGTTVTLDGATQPNFIHYDYDGAYAQQYKTNLWGAEAKFVIDSLTPSGPGFKLKPFFGARYLMFNETLDQYGNYNTFGPTTAYIGSRDTNNLYGGVLGFRSELEHQWFVVGVEPSVTLGMNSASSRVRTNQFVDPTDPERTSTASFTSFSPILEGKAYARINLRGERSAALRVRCLLDVEGLPARPHRDLRHQNPTRWHRAEQLFTPPRDRRRERRRHLGRPRSAILIGHESGI